MNDAGKVAFTPRGDYSSTVTYEYLDTVVYNGNAYVALKTTTGNAPGEDNENWALLARGGTSIPTATEDTQGAVKASEDIGVDSDAHMVLKTDFAEQTNLTDIQSGESRKTFFGKLAKAVSSLIDHLDSNATSEKAGHVKLSDSSAVTDSTGLALPVTEKNATLDGTMANQISTLNTNLVNFKNQFDNRKLKLYSSSYIDYYFCTRANQSFIEFPNTTLKKSIPANSWTKIIENIPTSPSLEVYREILVGDSTTVVIRIMTTGGVWAYSTKALQIGTQFMNGFSYI